MLPFATSFLSSLFLVAIAGHAQSDLLRGHTRRHARMLRPRGPTKSFTLTDMYQGNGFLNDWDFFTDPDPTHGIVSYQSKAQAISKGLAFVQADGTTVLAVDDKTVLPVGSPRDSIRISTKKVYSGGLFIADFFAMPHGCSVWPAYWSVGPNWPNGGEIDILEGAHEQVTNQYTIHTNAGCTLSTDNTPVTGKPTNTQCASSGDNNAGCSFLDTNTNAYGRQFNLIAGGVFAHLWDNTGIKVWRFARTMIPADITAKHPDPSLWGPPAAFFSASSCDIPSHFFNHSLILDTTLCGDLAGPTFSSAGCGGSCAETVADPKNYILAKWELNYIAVYQ